MRDIVSPLSGFGSPFGQRRRGGTLAPLGPSPLSLTIADDELLIRMVEPVNSTDGTAALTRLDVSGARALDDVPGAVSPQLVTSGADGGTYIGTAAIARLARSATARIRAS